MKSFLSYESQPSGASVLCFSHPELLGAHRREWLQPSGSHITQIFFSFLDALRAQKFTLGGLELLITETSLFIDKAGNAPFLTFMHDMGALTRGRRHEKQSDLSASLLGLVRSGQTCRNKSESVSRSVVFLSL